MPTRAGWTTLLAAVPTMVVGRAFGIVELFVIGSGMAAGVLIAVVLVTLRRPVLAIERWIHPAVLTVGDTGRVDLVACNTGRIRSPQVGLAEPVGGAAVARLALPPMAAGGRAQAAYRLPAERRGILRLGPLEISRRDVLGLARWRSLAAPEAEVMIAPRTHELAMPELGQGVLGRHLLTQAQRLGAGEFHGLRDYVAGDEPRSIHWRASARSQELKVRQHTTEGVRRCIVVLDRDAAGITDEGAESFERAIVVAASLVESSDRAGLTTRFVTSGGIDLRGPEVATTTLRVLAPIEPGGPLDHVDRDPGDGLGLVIVVTPSPASAAWRQTEQLLDPALSRIGVFTLPHTSHAGSNTSRLTVDASSIDGFCAGWDALAGHGGLDLRASLIRHAEVTA